MEAWKDIPGFCHYQASDQGRIRRKEGKVLTPLKAGCGYQKVIIHGQQLYIHRLIALTYLGEIPAKWEVNHLDFDRHNNRPENLEICTRKQNASHAAAPEWHRSQIRIPVFSDLYAVL